MYPIRRLRRSEISPESDASRPAKIFSSVDFPEPFAPINPMRSPSEMVSEIPLNRVRELKDFERLEQLARRAMQEGNFQDNRSGATVSVAFGPQKVMPWKPGLGSWLAMQSG